MPKVNDVRREIMDKAIRERVFSESCGILKDDGWGGFTMEKLAAAVGVAKGTLYNYFKDKLDVIVFVNEQLFDEVAHDVEALFTAEGDCRDILRASMSRGLEKMTDFRFLRMVMIEMHMKSVSKEEKKMFVRDPADRVRSAMVRFFKRGVDEGVFKPLPPETLEIFFTAAFDGLEVRSNFDQNFTPAVGGMFDDLMDMIIDGVSIHEKRDEK